MKTLAVCYSKTGTTKIVAEAIFAKLKCDLDILTYDEGAKTIKGKRNPANYEQIILLSPMWAFSLATPMKLYLNNNKEKIKSYSLIITSGSGWLCFCAKNCEKILNKPPKKAISFKNKNVKQNKFDIDLEL